VTGQAEPPGRNSAHTRAERGEAGKRRRMYAVVLVPLGWRRDTRSMGRLDQIAARGSRRHAGDAALGARRHRLQGSQQPDRQAGYEALRDPGFLSLDVGMRWWLGMLSLAGFVGRGCWWLLLSGIRAGRCPASRWHGRRLGWSAAGPVDAVVAARVCLGGRGWLPPAYEHDIAQQHRVGPQPEGGGAEGGLVLDLYV
jgi:hypothetical protein